MAVEEGDGEVGIGPAALLERKHAERLERLTLINQTRLQESSLRKSQSAASSDPRESVAVFMSAFSQKREVVERGLASARGKEIEPFRLRGHFDNLALEVTALEKLVADASYFLPAYDVRVSQTAILKLKDELDIASAELLPKKKFSFRNKAKKPSDGGTEQSQEGPVVSRSLESTGAEKSGSAVASSVQNGEDTLAGAKERSTEESAEACQEINTRERIQGKQNTVFARDADLLGGELTLSNLTNCKVYLRGRLTSLSLHRLRNCQIFCGPVTGSVFIEDVQSSVLVLASHQIRIHSTSATDFYLRVRSRPIVEYTSNNRFAPYAFKYQGIQEDLEAANLAEETGLWGKVDDFRWLRAAHSPNWSILLPKDRIPHEDGSNILGVGCDE